MEAGSCRFHALVASDFYLPFHIAPNLIQGSAAGKSQFWIFAPIRFHSMVHSYDRTPYNVIRVSKGYVMTGHSWIEEELLVKVKVRRWKPVLVDYVHQLPLRYG